MPDQGLRGLLLTRRWRDTERGIELEFWAASARGPLLIKPPPQQAVCFIPNRAAIRASRNRSVTRKPLALLDPAGMPVDALYFTRQADLNAIKDTGSAHELLEADIKPTDRFLMERFVTAGIVAQGTVSHYPQFTEISNAQVHCCDSCAPLRVVSLDIETSDLQGDLYSIALVGTGVEKVFMLGRPPVATGAPTTEYFDDVSMLLRRFFDYLNEIDPDLIIGWNIVQFDLRFLHNLCRRLNLALRIGRNHEAAVVLAPRRTGQQPVAIIPGRVALDGIELLRQAFWLFEDYTLQSVAAKLLGTSKLIDKNVDRVAEIQRLFSQDKAALAQYNLQDCRLVLDIFAKTDLVNFVKERARLTGLPLDRIGGSVAAFDNLYLPRLHRAGRVAPTTGQQTSHQQSPGGFVLDSLPGLYEDVLLLDFKSLYPSIIRTFRIDPLGLWNPGQDPVPGFLDAQFSRAGSILGDIVETLWRSRDEAKKQGDRSLSQAVKIIMNSFYGVLGSAGCRFFDPRLASSITRRGHEIIKRSREYFEDKGIKVIYGDTDSLFVLLGEHAHSAEGCSFGQRLATELNQWWARELRTRYRLESFLEVELETHFRRFLMPTVRGRDTGSKKRYAGLVGQDAEAELVIKGLESVRTDWTPLAREFQRELLRRVFLGHPYRDYIRDLSERLETGELDDKLIYRKRLRQPLEAYRHNVPPHAQAARKLASPPRWIRYVMTLNGPEPMENAPTNPDYHHYRSRQLAPAADAILPFLGTSFSALTDAQLTMF